MESEGVRSVRRGDVESEAVERAARQTEGDTGTAGRHS